MSMIGAVDIGGTKIAVGAAREDGVIAHRIEFPTDAAAGFADAMGRIRHALHRAIDACGPLCGIGIACPGPLDPFTGVLGDIGTLPEWQGGNLIEELQREFSLPIAVENDADAAALAEFAGGAGRGASNFIFITVSTGIGGGIVLDGRLYRGAGGSHPELGHQVLDRSGPLCYCSARGCWESLASGTAMSEWMFENSGGLRRMTAAAICDRATQGDELALRAVRREGYYLGLGLANLVTLLVPEVIALGGGVMNSGRLFMEDSLKVVRELCTQVPAGKTRILPAALGSEAGLSGAAQAWRMRYR